MEEEYSRFNSKIEVIYNDFITSTFAKGFWEDGEYKNERIKWTNADKVKSSLKILDESGVYIWGHKEEPIYIGKAEKLSFKRRFNRYIFSRNSQCKIAKLYYEHISNGGKLLSLNEIFEKFQLNPRKHKSRAIGVKSFGERDSNEIWFILLPFKKESISGLEIALIKAGEKWNVENGLKPLINSRQITAHNIGNRCTSP